MQLIELFQEMEALNASDLFITVGKKPFVRVMRKLRELRPESVTEADIEAFVEAWIPVASRERLERNRDLDIGVSVDPENRFRLSMFYQKGQLAIVVRRVPSGALSFAELRLPAVLQRFADAPRGLVLITGATGSGKSTTMAAMLHHINANSGKHIVTIEDPIEFLHEDLQSIVNQREIPHDTDSFIHSLRQIVRQSPDVIFIGELRDMDSIQTAISAAMAGHLVVTTMHTVDVEQTVERIVNYFPDQLRAQVATDLSFALQGIVSQRLLPTADGAGVVPALEILVATPVVRRLIASRELAELEMVIKGDANEGMQTFNRALIDLYREGLISLETGASAATNSDEFMLLVQGMETGIDSLRAIEAPGNTARTSMKSLLKAALRHGASDLLITAGVPPVLRIDGSIRELNLAAVSAADTQQLLFSVLTPRQRSAFEIEKEIDFALSVTLTDKSAGIDEPQLFRFRVNGFYQKGSVACALRVIPRTIPTPEELGLPRVIVEMANRMHGLILVTGPTGHGKSTTIACMIGHINQHRACHVITVEDPIEYVHVNNKAIIEQREVYADTKSFASALKYVLRQDPDVILIGEMRDPETIAAALTAAETGHLVLATLHTNDCAQSVDRIIDSFPAHQQGQIRSQLAASLNGVVAQRLLPMRQGGGRVAAFEVMTASIAIQALIRDNRTHQIASAIETGAKDGMMTMDKALQILYSQNKISRETVLGLARDRSIV